jgi:hypothetical protein
MSIPMVYECATKYEKSALEDAVLINRQFGEIMPRCDEEQPSQPIGKDGRAIGDSANRE